MSLQVTKIKNIPIKLHFTLIIVFFLITWMLTVNFMPRIFPGLGTYHYLTMGIVGAVILFISVIIHELAHSILSIKYGVRVHQIMLFIFGGVSDIKEEPKEHGKEFKIAIVGPIASFVLAGLFAASFWTVMQVGGEASSPFFVQTTTTEPGESRTIIPGLREEEAIPPEQQQQTIAAEILPYTEPQEIAIRILSGILVYGSIINVLLGAFNLLPAFPLDGGRVLRAALYRWKKNYDFATKTAVKVGTYISYGIMGFGFVSILFGSFIGGFWLILIGWFLQSGAQTYLQNYELSSILSKIRLKNIMNTRFIYVAPNLTVKELLDGFFNVYRKSEFPVMDSDKGILLGAITAKQAMNISQDMLDKIKINDIMIPVKELEIMNSNDHAYEALMTMFKKNKSRVYVCEAAVAAATKEHKHNQFVNKTSDEAGCNIIGIVSKSDILNFASETQEYTTTLQSARRSD